MNHRVETLSQESPKKVKKYSRHITHEMSSQLDSSTSRKRKTSSAVKNSRKVSATKRRYMKKSKMHSATESTSLAGGYSEAAIPLRRNSGISCECYQYADRRRCSASPEPEGQEGKENKLRTRLDVDGCSTTDIQDKPECEEMEYEETSKHLFPDDDSNQILPVEQFFGNLDIVQDFPQGSSASSVQKENRRRHFYAPEDSDEDEVGFSTTPQNFTRDI
ncbi:hypothetical protein JOB18_027929 [Solea senegalensis]|uniref:Uncharacterized protein n=1 Tax=Solea senegalensis TaxID=28829 RepID=A0AAV6STX0_SOLSE|nr:UPF0688 protein C1orf174 homolog [Solea senegalensis]KAG7520355.1 hypothetical protein JOB18_027929 [Solea senegalensis]